MPTPADSDHLTAVIEKIGAAVSEGNLSSSADKNLRRWLTEPQYANYVPRILELIEQGAYEQLDTMFWETLAFGTGGRRGLMAELGCATINERTIAESAHGLAVYLKKTREDSGGSGVVAHDSRNRSSEFARLTAGTLAAHGLKVFLFDSNRSTPELSFAVRHLGCDVGVMISASHNPPSDNGFKAYWSTGGQVLAPHDQGIIDCVYKAVDIPVLDIDQAVNDGRIEIIGEEIDRAYLDCVKALSLSSARDIPILYSPLHGVGETSVYRVLEEAGFSDLDIYGPQREPDGDFPNVPDQFPNPERSEVFSPLIKHAAQSGAELILASDPDADRLGVAVQAADGTFRHLTGNQVGALLTEYVLGQLEERGVLTPEHYIVHTLVTTPLMTAIAAAHGVRFVNDLLVGFKYIAETMEQRGPEEFVFGAEESLGYLSGHYCRDKDATIAALFISELAAELRARGKTLCDACDELYLRHGYFVERQQSEVCRGPRGKEQIDGLMVKFRESPPDELAGIPLVQVRDYGRHEIRTLPANTKTQDIAQPDGNLLIFDSDDDDCQFTVAVRPSGTEPKIKFYLFGRAAIGGLLRDRLVSEAATRQVDVLPSTSSRGARCGDTGKLDSLKQRTDARLSEFQAALSQWIRCALAEPP